MDQMVLTRPGDVDAPASRWRRPVVVLTLLAVAQFIDVLDVTIVNVALPHIQRDLHVAGNNLQWIISIYVLFYGGFLLLGGRLADALGRRRVFTMGLALFGLSSLAAGFAPNTLALIAVRATQGMGGAMMAPAALSLLTVAFPAGRQRDVALGIWGGLAGLGGTLGVVIGGVLVDTLSWRWIFFVNVPTIVAIIALTPLVLSESRSSESRRGVDVAGAVLGTGALLALVLGVIRTGELGWGSGEVLALLGASAALGVAFVRVERRAVAPMLPLSLLRVRGLTMGSLMLAVNGAGILAVFYLSSTFLQLVRHESALGAGLEFLPMGVAAIVGAVLAGQAATRVGTRPVQLVGAAMTLLGLIVLATVTVDGSYVTTFLPGFVLFGAGITTLGVPTQIAAVAGVEHETAGVSSGVMAASYQVGGALGLAVITTLTTSHATHLIARGLPLNDALAGGFRFGVAVAVGLSLLNGAIAWRSPSVRPARGAALAVA
ncbi:MAG: MFS transporter [Acidimicrobiales bacterium]